MRSPTKIVLLEDEDISDLVESLTYEDSIKKDNMCTLSIIDDFAFKLLDNPKLRNYAKVYFNFGFIGEPQSETHSAFIGEIETSYGSSGIRLSIKCFDSGNIIKKTSEKVIHANLSSSSIAEKIADKYGFKKFIDTTTKIHKSMPQANLSDFELLKKLSVLENNFIFYIRNNELHFRNRKFSETSSLTISYGDNNLIEFKPASKPVKTQGSVDNSSVSNINDSGEESTSTASPNEKTDNSSLGNNVYNYTADLKETFSSNVEVKKTVNVKTEDEEESKNVSSNLKTEEETKENTSSLSLIGNPILKPSQIITIGNVAKRHEGNYQIVSISHKLSSSSYTTDLELTNNGTNLKSKSTVKSVNPNSTVGNGENLDKVKLIRYDIDGVELK